MAYQKQIWENLPSTNTPLSADRLNHMEQGIYDANNGLVESQNSSSNSTTNPYSANYSNNNFISKYNLITDGNAVKTGRQIDGKDEYVKRFHFTGINSVAAFTKSLGFTLDNVIITESSGMAYSNSYNWFPIPMGDFSTTSNYAIRYSLISTNDILQLNTANTNFTEANVNIYYISRN